jgi:hypothetical protein
MESHICAICDVKYTKKTRISITCQYCSAAACRQCQQSSILSTHDDPSCYSCKRSWNSEFIIQNFTRSFHNNTLRKHRRKVLLQREKALLPAMQIFVQAKKNIYTYSVIIMEKSKVQQEKLEVLKQLNLVANASFEVYNTLWLKKQAGTLLKISQKNEYIRAKNTYKKDLMTTRDFDKNEYAPAYEAWLTARRTLQHWVDVYAGDNTDSVQATEFLMRCPSSNCRGFLSASYVCGTCNKTTCFECLEIKEDIHLCKPEMIETAKAIRRDTKACPKCGIRIFKIDGCDQMWCTNIGCNTAFSWNTGRIVTGRIHNPHYYQWLQQNGGAPRETTDIPCGGVPTLRVFYTSITSNRFIYKNENERLKLLNIHRCLLDIEARLMQYPSRPHALQNKEINVKYLTNEINEEQWAKLLVQSEKRFLRKKEIGQILQTLVISSADILREIIERFNDTRHPMISAKWYKQIAEKYLDALIIFTNESLQTLSKTQRIAVPQIGPEWQWVPTRALYRQAKPTTQDDPSPTEVSV